jgi:hypothetical protein
MSSSHIASALVKHGDVELCCQQLAIDVEPPLALPNETTALVLANGGGIADARTRDELYLGRSSAGKARINHTQP